MQNLRDQLTLLPQIEYPKWESFEFVTKRKGATGPTKSECFDYYHARLVQKAFNCAERRIYFSSSMILVFRCYAPFLPSKFSSSEKYW